MNTLTMTTLVNLTSEVINLVRSASSLNDATSYLFNALDDNYKAKLVAKDSDYIQEFNKIMAYIRPNVVINSVDRYRRVNVAKFALKSVI